MEKYFTIQGNLGYLHQLLGVAVGDISFAEDFLTDAPSYVMYIRHLNEVEDLKRVLGEAKFMSKIIEGAFNILLGDKGITLGLRIVNVHDATTNIALPQKEEYNEIFKPHYIYPDFEEELAAKFKKKGFIDYAFYLAKYNRTVESVLLLSSNKPSFINLYCIYDSIRTLVGKPNFSEFTNRHGYSDENINSFRGTANNYGLIGIEARHGDCNWGTPNDVMSLANSQKMILSLAYEAILET